MKDKIYISGGMSNVPREHYLERFALAEKLLKGAGYERIVNPTRFWVCRWPWIYRTIERMLGKDRAYVIILLYDLWQLSRCTRIYKIPTWKQSRGANIESCLAYHMKIWNPSKKVVAHCDKQMEKMIARQGEVVEVRIGKPRKATGVLGRLIKEMKDEKQRMQNGSLV